jgi:uncharacterized coiled-coil protein SlyX
MQKSVENELLAEIRRLKKRIAAQDALIAELRATVAAKDERIAELELIDPVQAHRSPS